MGLEAPSHWIIIAVIVIALFGYKKMPDAARSIGRSLRIFKGEIKEMTEHETAPAVSHESMAETPAPVAAAPKLTDATPVRAVEEADQAK